MVRLSEKKNVHFLFLKQYFFDNRNSLNNLTIEEDVLDFN